MLKRKNQFRHNHICKSTVSLALPLMLNSISESLPSVFIISPTLRSLFGKKKVQSWRIGTLQILHKRPELTPHTQFELSVGSVFMAIYLYHRSWCSCSIDVPFRMTLQFFFNIFNPHNHGLFEVHCLMACGWIAHSHESGCQMQSKHFHYHLPPTDDLCDAHRKQ